jgi:orotate phosphoribosyltransferase-like protein
VEEHCIPADTVFAQQLNAELNLFLPKAHFKEGAGFSNLGVRLDGGASG